MSKDLAVREDDLRAAWLEFAEMRKHQIAEYNLMKKEISFNGVTITIRLSNPIEQPLLQNIRVQLIAHLRGKLNNNSINIEGVLVETEEKRIAYTAKEKFDALAEKNPALKELKERFGLDPDF